MSWKKLVYCLFNKKSKHKVYNNIFIKLKESSYIIFLKLDSLALFLKIFFFLINGWVEATNVIILPECDHSSTLFAGSGALLGCKKTIISHNFPAPRKTLVNLKLLKKVSQMSPYSNLNLRSQAQHILCIT